MRRPLAWCAVVLVAQGCGLVIDGAYLLTDKRSHQSVEQRRPTGQAESAPERRLSLEGQRLRVVCEDVTRGVDRVWTVEKTFENQGGFYQAHWLPIILEGAIGTGLAIGLGAKCSDPASGVDCHLLYATIPFAVDVAYSIVRLLTIDPPKLVDKRATPPHTEPHPEPTSRVTTACEGDTTVTATAPSRPGDSLQLTIDASGYFTPELQSRLLSYARTNHDARVSVFAGEQRALELSRCDFFRAIAAGHQAGAWLPPECEAPSPTR